MTAGFPSQGDPALAPRRPNRWVTLGLTLLLVVFGLPLLLFRPASPLASLQHPVASAVRVLEREVALEVATEQAPAWQRLALLADVVHTRSTIDQAIDGYEELLAAAADDQARVPDSLVPSIRARLAVLLAEAGRWDEAERALAELRSPTGPRLEVPPGQVTRFADVVRYAYRGASGPPPPLEPALTLLAPTAEPRLEPGWAGERLAARYSARAGVEAETRAADARLAARGSASGRLEAALGLSLLTYVAIAAGLGLGLWRLWRRRGLPVLATGLRTPPWSGGTGYAVLVRAAFWGGLVGLVAYFAWEETGLGGSPPLGTLLASLPMLWVLRRVLLGPRGLNLGRAFGLRLTAGPGALVVVTLVLVAVEQLCSLGAGLLAAALGVESHWTESLAEEIVWGAAPLAAASLVDGVVWAPLFEEIAFRGLLYTTLRTRLPALGAAALSAGLFSGLHFYSLAGFLALFGAALVAALVYERSRSLLPCILAHVFNNVLAFGYIALMYR